MAGKGLFTDAASQHIAAAARSYQQAYESWRRMNGLIGHGTPDSAGKNPQRRAEAASAVREAARHERDAIAALTRALATIDRP